MQVERRKKGRQAEEEEERSKEKGNSHKGAGGLESLSSEVGAWESLLLR